MLKNVISQGNFAIWPSISLVIFTLTFLGILLWIYRKNAAKHYHDMANMILDDDCKQPETKNGR